MGFGDQLVFGEFVFNPSSGGSSSSGSSSFQNSCSGSNSSSGDKSSSGNSSSEFVFEKDHLRGAIRLLGIRFRNSSSGNSSGAVCLRGIRLQNSIVFVIRLRLRVVK